jgi:L-seryl-tRNA(Ser) seleniumtransferase
MSFSALRRVAIRASSPRVQSAPKPDPMHVRNKSELSSLPSVDRLLRTEWATDLVATHGRLPVTNAIRDTLADVRATLSEAVTQQTIDDSILRMRVQAALAETTRSSLRRVFNLTGTVLHTNLGRARLSAEAASAVALAATAPSNVELDLDEGRRGDRDVHVESALCRLTGAEAATVVNNNAAAVMLALNTLARGKEVPTSRGELIEIGGSFRMPEIMASSGCTLVEIGTTNRVRLDDYARAIGRDTGAVMKVCPSNYEIVGFTAVVDEAELAALCRSHGVPLIVDLGSGSLVDLRTYGLPHEPMPSESIAHGADLVTFSADKLLGGPQAGIIVGRADLVEALKRNPMKRALRVDKLTLAGLSATLALYEDPDRLAERLPVLVDLTRPVQVIHDVASRMRAVVAAAVGTMATVTVTACESQIGSGALPTRLLPSAGLEIRPVGERVGSTLAAIARAFRHLPVPVLGRVHDDALIFDCRCLDDEAGFEKQLANLRIAELN